MLMRPGPRRMGLPSLLHTAVRAAVWSGTATAVSARVAAAQQANRAQPQPSVAAAARTSEQHPETAALTATGGPDQPRLAGAAVPPPPPGAPSEPRRAVTLPPVPGAAHPGERSASPAPPAPPAPPELTEAVAAQLRRLGELRDAGLVTEEEFTAKKRQLLGLAPPHLPPPG